MSLDPELLKELVATFKSELDEQLQLITDELLALEKQPPEESQLFADKIAIIFRAAHNIKGAARGLGINNIGEIAHRIESLFAAIQKKEFSISRDLIDLCLEAVDKMKSSMQSYLTHEPLNFDFVDFLKKMDLENSKTQPKKKAPEVNKAPPKISESISPESKIQLHPSEKTQEKLPEKNPLTTTAIDSIRIGVDKLDKVSTLMEEIQVNKIAIDDYYAELIKLNHKIKQSHQLWKLIDSKIKEKKELTTDEGLKRVCHTNNDYLLEISNMSNHLQKNVRSQVNELSILSDSLQEEVRRLRLVPASIFLGTLPRYARDLSQEVGKEVELTITGSEVKIDKFVLEGLKDPIIHLLRNAIDHGIEETAVREEKGKKVGKINIDIKKEGNQIIIAMTDDGAGIDINKVAQIAQEKNLVAKTELQTMSENEILDYIFQPGFTTKEIITDISGRGIGLNVVRTNLIDLKGEVKVMSEVGKGTTFMLRVPITLSSERGLLVNSYNLYFVIPTSSIERILHLQTSDIIEVEGTHAILLNKHTIPLRILADILNFEKVATIKQNKLPIIVIKRGNQFLALMVDKIIGEREIVIKRLNLPLMNVNCVAGATLLERNQAVIVLNPNDLIDTGLNIRTTNRFDLQSNINKESSKLHILVVDDSITTRTLEKNILENKNYAVTVAVNGKEAWDILQKQTFSLLITDVSMPIMDGFTLTEHVKKSDKLKNLPVIIVTSLDSKEEKSRGIEVGADAYIVKSEFESGDLLEIIEQLV